MVLGVGRIVAREEEAGDDTVLARAHAQLERPPVAAPPVEGRVGHPADTDLVRPDVAGEFEDVVVARRRVPHQHLLAVAAVEDVASRRVRRRGRGLDHDVDRHRCRVGRHQQSRLQGLDVPSLRRRRRGAVACAQALQCILGRFGEGLQLGAEGVGRAAQGSCRADARRLFGHGDGSLTREQAPFLATGAQVGEGFAQGARKVRIVN